MRTIHRNQAEIEARDIAKIEKRVVTVYKLEDGRYEVARGWHQERAGSALARFNCNRQEF